MLIPLRFSKIIGPLIFFLILLIFVSGYWIIGLYIASNFTKKTQQDCGYGAAE